VKYLVLSFCLLYGVYHYVSRKFEFHDTLVHAHKHKSAGWSAPVEYYVGLVYYQRAEYGKAQEAFTMFREDHPEDSHMPRALVMLGDAAEYTQDWDVARAALAQYIEKYPAGRDIALVKSRLELVNYKHGPAR
jgi:outer membrane protein assembly factor BamD (BamD/ComL family)